MRDPRTAALSLLAGLLLATSAFASQWPICHTSGCTSGGLEISAPSNYLASDAIADGDGGVIYVTFSDALLSGISAHRISFNGDKLWGPDGILISGSGSQGRFPQLVSDGASGAIVAWEEYSGGSGSRVRVQRVREDGSLAWTPGGVGLTTRDRDQWTPMIVRHGSGAVISWTEDFSVGDSDIYAQRLDASGLAQWGEGAAVCTQVQIQHSAIPVKVAGGTMMYWRDERHGDIDIFGELIDDSGNPVWNQFSLGDTICVAAGDQTHHQVMSDGTGGAYVVWEDRRYGAGDYDIAGERVDSGGNLLWSSGPGTGLLICGSSGDQTLPQIALGPWEWSTYSSDLIVVWVDDRSGTKNIWTERLAPDGDLRWDPIQGGKSVQASSHEQNKPRALAVTSSYTMVAWEEDRVGNTDVMIARLDGSGNSNWGSRIVSRRSENESGILMAGDGVHGAYLGWTIGYAPSARVHSQRVTWEGHIGYPSPNITEIFDSPGDQGGSVVLTWNRSYWDRHVYEIVTHYTVWREAHVLPPEPPAGQLTVRSPLEVPVDWDGAAVWLPEQDEPGRGAGDGYWELVASVPAIYNTGYGSEVPTHGDSTGTDLPHTLFKVVAHPTTSSSPDDDWFFWESAPMPGYSVDNLSPGAPGPLYGMRQNLDVALNWDHSTEDAEDLSLYRVYRDTQSGFTPDPGKLVGATTDTLLVDTSADPGTTYYYLVAGVDVHDNEGNTSNEAEVGPVTGISVSGDPTTVWLGRCRPNPFTTSAEIRFGLPEAQPVRLDVFDAAGRLVANLESGSREAGVHTVRWSGLDSRGLRVTSGMYFFRLETAERSHVRKTVLLRQ